MESNSQYKHLTSAILALCLFSIIYGLMTYEPLKREEIRIDTIIHLNDTIEKIRIKKQYIKKSIHSYDTIYLDTYSRDLRGLKSAIDLHRHIDSIECESLSRWRRKSKAQTYRVQKTGFIRFDRDIKTWLYSNDSSEVIHSTQKQIDALRERENALKSRVKTWRLVSLSLFLLVFGLYIWKTTTS